MYVILCWPRSGKICWARPSVQFRHLPVVLIPANYQAMYSEIDYRPLQFAQ